jgi:hypothetical protein
MKSSVFPLTMSVTRDCHSAQTLSDYQAASKEYLRNVVEIIPSAGRLRVLGKEDFVLVKEDLSNLESAIAAAVVVGSRDTDFFPPLSCESLGPQTVHRFGYDLDYFLSDSSACGSNECDLRITIRGCSMRAGSSSLVTAAFYSDFVGLEAANCLKALLLMSVKKWGASFGSVRSSGMVERVSIPGDFCAGDWLYYFPFDDLSDALPPDIANERFFGGTVIQTSPHLPDPGNPAHLQYALRVREALDHLGLVWHSTYAIHGWPPDEEEWRYEEFITGAPRGRKYRVRCIDFDGYDAQRDVLLYAKLFRRLRHQRKEWGLRGWDGPVLNEARRQVRAANGTQIEWHVGLEEPAARVRTLLADYTDFKDEQLRVIYTPVSAALSP